MVEEERAKAKAAMNPNLIGLPPITSGRSGEKKRRKKKDSSR